MPEYSDYTVLLTFRYPAHDERDGILYDVRANSKRDAIKQARRAADNGGNLVGLTISEYSFRCVEREDDR